MKAYNEIGLVLGGGGAKGAYQIGVLKAMSECRILGNVTSVSGTSAGGLNAMMLAGLDCHDLYHTVFKMESIWRDFKFEHFTGTMLTKPEILKSLKFIYDVDQTPTNIFCFGIFNQKGIMKLIDENISLEKLCKNPMDCYINCHKFWWLPVEKSYETFYITDSFTPCQLKNIALATAAIPFLYKPRVIGDKICDDGGIGSKASLEKGISNIPFKILIDKGYTQIIVVHFGNNLRLEVDKNVNVIEIHPDSIKPTDTFDFSKTSEWIDLGYRDAKKQFEKNRLFVDGVKKGHIQRVEKSYKWGKTKPINDMEEIALAIKELREEIIIYGDYAKFIAKLNEAISGLPKAATVVGSITTVVALSNVLAPMGGVFSLMSIGVASGIGSFSLIKKLINTFFIVGGANILTKFIKYEVFVMDKENYKIALYLKDIKNK
ncbi:MAG: hypothetical protein HDT25_10860 [Ruminococcus sp.]|nr:hypothetical protein [Ruminococcus sp.]